MRQRARLICRDLRLAYAVRREYTPNSVILGCRVRNDRRDSSGLVPLFFVSILQDLVEL